MKIDRIRTALAKYLHKESDTILLETLVGKPRSAEGGEWIEVQVTDFESITEDPEFDCEATGYKKYLDQWYAEGLITVEEKSTGKSQRDVL